MEKRLESKVAVVTGGASGLGAQTVRRFVKEGANVVFTDVQTNLGAALAEETGAHFAYHDVTDRKGWESIMEMVQSRHSRLDVLVNNAGIITGKSIEDVDAANWNRIVGINLTGVLLGCQFGISVMRKNPEGASGSLINVASTCGFVATPGDVGYSATKFAVRGLTRSVAVHCAISGYQIRCNTIAPGVIDTPIIAPTFESVAGAREIFSAMSPLGHIGSPDDIAAMAVFLASDESKFCTGADYLVDGGTLAGHPGLSTRR